MTHALCHGHIVLQRGFQMYPIPAPYRVSSLHVRIVGLWHMAVKRSIQSFAVVIVTVRGAAESMFCHTTEGLARAMALRQEESLFCAAPGMLSCYNAASGCDMQIGDIGMTKPSPRKKPPKIGRNDPCWCGSGKKYKDCHQPIEQAQRAEQMKLNEAQDTLMAKIIEAAREMPEEFPAAMEHFWNGEYSAEQMIELDDMEQRGSERFLTWFAFDHLLSDGSTLVELLARTADAGIFEVDEYEARLLHAWGDTRMRPYVAERIHKGRGLTLRDLLEEGVYEVKDHGAPRRMEEGEVLVGHLVPVGVKGAGEPPAPGEHKAPPASSDEAVPLYFIAGAVAHLTADTREKLLEFAALHLEDLRRTRPEATWCDLVRQRSYVLNHFVMALPVEEYNPTLLDDILLEARTTLHLTGQALSGLAGRQGADSDDEEEAGEDNDDESSGLGVQPR